ncbi:unnamed protein product [Tilletia laevis]|uniref:Enoyl reductase (ER) domain-containing protein n=4 Tax=Tilletia TaxID=13289 RepID=A0A8X7MKY9_9BASI|nr:hypothetical protein CF336_g9000 [Tilletia laevis]KAE8181779.1 hypothetical protein CF328_g8734 [Tilletia controversa]CAD6905920.1 unnamed protein product [Tilletia caries]KAE8239790.1 hypothetical protein A4X06_0g8043 [Tilletia controversa]CAD6909481.1 unnamed protein product [Tilletia laevis]
MSASSVSAEAWQITKPGSIPDTLELRSITLPNLKPNQVLIKVSHAALNPADYKLAAILPTFIQKVPRTAASDFSGTVVKLGSDALAKKYEWLREENVAVWGLIFNLPPTSALGAMSTYTVAEVECIHPLPTNTAAIEAGVTAESAAGLGIVSLTAYLQAQYVKKGDRVFINGGTTAVGLIAADLAIAKGASLIVATASGSKADFIKKRGVNEVIDHRASDPKQELLSRYSSAPFDVVLDCIGTPDLHLSSPAYLKADGKWINIGASFHRTLVFAGLSKYDLVEVNKLLVEGTIHPVVDKVFEWKDGVEAYKYLIEGRAVGKVVVAVP